MSEFARTHPIKDPYWAVASDVSILSAACLSFGFEPTALADYQAAMGEPASEEGGELPAGFSSRVAALKSAVRAEKIHTTRAAMDDRGGYKAQETFIRMNEFLEWCKGKGIEVKIPGLRMSTPASDNLPSVTREKMLKIIIGMAMKKYEYKPGATRKSASGENNGSIKADLDSLGISIDADTIRNYLKEAEIIFLSAKT